MTDLVVRPLVPGEAHLFESLPDPGLVGFQAFGDTYSALAAEGKYRPEWTWVALRDKEVVARAAWWGGPEDDAPLTLDWFDFTDPDAASELLRTAPLRAEYILKLKTSTTCVGCPARASGGGWRTHPPVSWWGSVHPPGTTRRPWSATSAWCPNSAATGTRSTCSWRLPIC
jgi:hypothetical protein